MTICQRLTLRAVVAEGVGLRMIADMHDKTGGILLKFGYAAFELRSHNQSLTRIK